jgi:hypothetical protein
MDVEEKKSYNSFIAQLIKQALKETYDNETNLETAANTIIHLFQPTLVPKNVNKDALILHSPPENDKIKALRSKVKNLLEKDTLKALQELKKQLKEDCPIFNEVIILIATYNRTHKYLLKGTINYQEALIEFNKVDNSVILMTDEIETDDLR